MLHIAAPVLNQPLYSVANKLTTRKTLPYFAPLDHLPGVLPTVDEILSVAILNESRTIGRVREHFMVSCGRDVSYSKSDMLFVRRDLWHPCPYCVCALPGTRPNALTWSSQNMSKAQALPSI